jgi:hypothetical protein
VTGRRWCLRRGEADPYLPRVRKLSLQADPSHCLPSWRGTVRKGGFLLPRAACRLHHCLRFVTCFVTPAPAFREGAQPLRTRRSRSREDLRSRRCRGGFLTCCSIRSEAIYGDLLINTDHAIAHLSRNLSRPPANVCCIRACSPERVDKDRRVKRSVFTPRSDL